MPLLLTRSGRLTRYALACGYIERVVGPKVIITLLMDGSVVLVRVYNRETRDRYQCRVGSMREGYWLFGEMKRIWLAQGPNWPWCETCRSYHHPENPTCAIYAPQKADL